MAKLGPYLQGSGARHDVLRALFKLTQRERMDVLEVGSWVGETALLWAKAINECPRKGSVLCVDPWTPYMSERDLSKRGTYAGMDDMLREGSAFALFLENIQGEERPRGVPINFYRTTLPEVAHQLAPAGFDLVYIDGSHYLEAVKADIKAARGLVREGGLLVGDDLELQGNAVNLELAGSLSEEDYASVGSPGQNYHPGVTVAVWEAFGPVWEQNGVWAMQKKDGQFVIPNL